METKAAEETSKPTMYQLCRLHHINLASLARASQTHPLLVWDLLINNKVERHLALTVLAGFNHLAQATYQLTDLTLALKDEKGTPHYDNSTTR